MTSKVICERNNHTWRYCHAPAHNMTAIVCVKCGALNAIQEQTP